MYGWTTWGAGSRIGRNYENAVKWGGIGVLDENAKKVKIRPSYPPNTGDEGSKVPEKS